MSERCPTCNGPMGFKDGIRRCWPCDRRAEVMPTSVEVAPTSAEPEDGEIHFCQVSSPQRSCPTRNSRN